MALVDAIDLDRFATASMASIVVFPEGICDSRKPCSKVGESRNPFGSSKTDALAASSNVRFAPSLDGEFSRENNDCSPNGSVWEFATPCIHPR